jgi:hypothetical protein
MPKLTKVLLVCTFAAALAAAAPAAQAQLGECWDTCDPYSSSCDQYCQNCEVYTIDNGCLSWSPSTCGESLGACIPGNCTPNWSESRAYRGSYGNGDFHWTYWECTHHVVELVTVTDTNNCNINSSYRSFSYCDDTIDHSESGSGYQDCCDGGWYCDGHHSC